MTGPAWIVLGSLAAVAVLESVAALLNVGRLPRDDSRRRSYHARAAGLDLTRRIVSLNLFAGFWIAGGFGWLDALVTRSCPHSIPAAGLFFGCLFAAGELAALLFAVARTFGLETAFGFNRTTPALFLSDCLKGWGLSATVGGGLIAALVVLLERFGPDAWIPAWALTAAALVLLVLLAPVMLLPLFNRLTPLPNSPLRAEIETLCERCRFPVRDVLRVDASRRSSRANAFFTGLGPTRRVVLFDTLLENRPQPEILAIVAHELGHARKGHIPKRLAANLLVVGVAFALGAALISSGLAPALAGVPGSTHPHLQLLGAGLGLWPVFWLAGIAGHAWSRVHEFEADRFAAEALGNPRPMADALARLGRDHLAHPSPHPLWVWLNATHPSIPDRIERLIQPAAR